MAESPSVLITRNPQSLVWSPGIDKVCNKWLLNKLICCLLPLLMGTTPTLVPLASLTCLKLTSHSSRQVGSKPGMGLVTIWDVCV